MLKIENLTKTYGNKRAVDNLSLQIAPGEMAALPALREQIEGGLKAVGYRSVAIDPEGYRSPA